MSSLFKIPERSNRNDDLTLAQKSRNKVRSTISLRGNNTLLQRIQLIQHNVSNSLGTFKDDYIVIRDIDTFSDYISKCIKSGYISVDTETTGLDPILDKIVGLCLYAPGLQAAYIPINHVSYITSARIDNQLNEHDIEPYMQKIVDSNIKVIMFNAKFDIRVIKNQVGVQLPCYWDGYLAGRCLNENEPNKGLKALHKKYVLKGQEDAFSFDELFKGITADLVPIDTFYLYAAHDAIITYELFKFQEPYLSLDQEREDLRDVAWVFKNIEMPCVEVVSVMEDTGIDIDLEYNKKLSIKYNRMLKEKEQEFYDELKEYSVAINKYKEKNINHKLDDPINISSPSQLATLFYDILHYEPPNPKKPRATGKEELEGINSPLAKRILDYRAVAKLINTYIDKMPGCVNPKDGRIHCSFNQYGADTGRMSSNSPNLQNIPSHNTDIRKMFKATDGYLMMSSDFSSQEPKTLAALCAKMGDTQLLDTFLAGKDLYSEIASKAFNYSYEDCLEFYLDENGNKTNKTNKEGKSRRTQAKSILLGTLYGRGEASIAEQLGCSVDDAKEIKDSVFRGFPAIKRFESGSIEMAKTLGYVTTVCGRKRRLPDLQLPEYEFKWVDGSRIKNDDPLGFDDEINYEVPEELCQKYLRILRRTKFSEKRKVFEKANNDDGIWIIDNHMKIADSTRQCVNARVQGGAADLTKLAMIKLYHNERLKELGFRMLVPVHDEIIAECPEENIKECSQLLAEMMCQAAEEILKMPISTDVAISRVWYGEEIEI